MKEVITRTLTGILFIFVVIGSVLIHWVAFASVLGILLILAVNEWQKLNRSGSVQLHDYLMYFTAVLLFLSFVCTKIFDFPWFLPVLLLLLPIIATTETLRGSENILKTSAVTFFGAVYLAVPFGLLVMMHGNFPDFSDGFFIISLFAVIWAYDTLAYCSGILFGKHKLCERISPKKTWEGLIGGTLLTLILMFIANRLFVKMDDLTVILAGMIIITASTFGDMFESVLKRNAGVKDSGTIFPGHGGVLDRFDSVFFAVIPYVLFLLFYVKPLLSV